MAYVPGFKYDIFISYPRENNRADPEGVQWVRELDRYLKVAIANQIPSKDQPEIFFDDHDFESGQHVAKLLDHARDAAIFLAVVSPPYVAPGKFTLKELEAFCGSRDAREQIIVSVYFLPIRAQDEPAELHGPKKFEFFWANENNVPVPLTPRTDPKSYTSKLYTLANHIINRLDEMRRKRIPPADVQAPAGAGAGMAVLLGQVTDDLVDTREELKEFIEKLGAVVLPPEDYPAWGPQFTAAFGAQLAKADLVVQLLSKVRSQKGDGDQFSCAQFQHQATTDAQKPVLQWREPSDISKVQHYDRPILEMASAMTLEQFKVAVRKKLEELTPPPEPAAALPAVDEAESGHAPFIYITAHPEDLDRALKLKGIADSLGAARIMEDQNKLKDFIEQVPFAEAVVFLYGDAPRKFVDDWLAKYLKLKTTQFKTHPQLEAVYYAPPPKSETQRQLRTGWKGLRAFGSQDAFTPEDMRKIFVELRGGPAR